jgi:hypothetical protein
MKFPPEHYRTLSAPECRLAKAMPALTIEMNRCAIASSNVGSRTHGRDTFRYENLPWFSPFGPAFGCSNSFLTNLCAAKDKFAGSKLGRAKHAQRVCATTGTKQQYPKDKSAGSRFGRHWRAKRERLDAASQRPPGCRLNPARRDFRRESVEGRSFALYRRASSMKRPFAG